jgi:hypothetical protein
MMISMENAFFFPLFLLDLRSALTLPNATLQKLTNQLGEGRRYKYHILYSISSFKILKSKKEENEILAVGKKLY